MNASTNRTLSLLLIDYLDYCRQEQRIFDNMIRRHNINGEHLYNILYRYLNIIENDLLNINSLVSTTNSNSNNNENTTVPNSRRRVRLNPIVRSSLRSPGVTTILPSIFSNLGGGLSSRIGRSGLSDATIERTTETHVYSDISTNEIMCPITQDLFIPSDLILKIIECGHIFKEIPLRRWFSRNSLCPVCRHDLQSSNVSSRGSVATPRSRAYNFSASIS